MYNTILEIVGIAIGIVGIFFGFFESYRRKKLENILKTITRTYPGEVAKIEQSCRWASVNFRNAHEVATNMPDSAEKKTLLKFLNQGTADAAASARLCVSLFNQLLSFQQAQFDTRNIIHSERDKLDLCKDELKNSNRATT